MATSKLHIYFDSTKQPYFITNADYHPYVAHCFGINVETFQKMSYTSKISKKGLEELAPGIKVLSKAEGLVNHWKQIECRLKNSTKSS